MVGADSCFDEWTDGLRFLLGDGVEELLDAYCDHLGGRLVGSRARQVAYRSSGSTTAQYRVEVAWPNDLVTTETYVVATGGRPVSGATVFADGSSTASVWSWSSDPALPGLADALDARRVGRLFVDLGIDIGDVALRVRAYRPGRRAVIEAGDGRQRLFLKVVRPDRVEELHSTHRRLATCLPVPDSVGWTDHGVMVLPAVGGETLRDALRRGAARLPTPAAIPRLLAALPPGIGRAAPRETWLEGAQRHASVIDATVPSARPQLRRTVERLVDLADSAVRHDEVTVHGDFYEAQLMVDGASIVGLLDVDTIGTGHRIDDAARLCAHLSVLGTVWPNPRPVNRFGAEFLADAERRYDRHDLRTRIAAATIGLATGPFRTLEPDWEANTRTRLSLANRWLDGAEHRRSA